MMKPSHISLSALLAILLLLFVQASATQSRELSTATKKWRNYIWSPQSTTSSVTSIPSATSIPSHGQDSSFGKVKAAAQRIAASFKTKAPQKIVFKYPEVRNVEDHTHETAKQRAQRKLDCAAIEWIIELEEDPKNFDELNFCGTTLVEAQGEHSRRVCSEFSGLPSGAPPSDQQIYSLLTGQSSTTTSPAPSHGSNVQNARWLVAGKFDVLADLFRCAIALVIMTPLVLFYHMLVIIYRDGDGFQPGEALDFVVDALKVEEMYEVVALAPYVYLVRKVAGTIDTVRAWASHWKASKPVNKESDAIPLENCSSLHADERFLLRLELLMKDRAQEEDEDADAEDSDVQENTEDRDWLVVNED